MTPAFGGQYSIQLSYGRIFKVFITAGLDCEFKPVCHFFLPRLPLSCGFGSHYSIRLSYGRISLRRHVVQGRHCSGNPLR